MLKGCSKTTLIGVIVSLRMFRANPIQESLFHGNSSQKEAFLLLWVSASQIVLVRFGSMMVMQFWLLVRNTKKLQVFTINIYTYGNEYILFSCDSKCHSLIQTLI